MPLPQYRMNALNRSLHDLVSHLRDGALILDPPYQRGDVWTPVQRVNLIHSLLLGVPIAALVLNQRSGVAWYRNEGDPGNVHLACVDGRQRLTTVRMWWDDEISIPAEWLDASYLPEKYPSLVRNCDLSERGRRFCRNDFAIPSAEAQLPSLAAEAEVYGLINAAGTPQTEEDLARARALADT